MTTFVVTILCDLTSLAAPTSFSTMQIYTISQTAESMTFPAFIPTPSVCPLTYSYAVSPATSLVSFDLATRTFSFYEEIDMSLTLAIAPYYKSYTVTIIASSGSVS